MKSIFSKNIKDKLFNSINLNLNIDGGSINLNESILLNEKIGKLNLKNSSFLFENDELIFNGYFNFEIKNHPVEKIGLQLRKSMTDMKNLF